ncbi:MAG TPA: efflux RND transporter periplasmic adaptor subunit [Bryobacteraceae bacterium]|nr:efflux RND transporter periplasmic adaptor subunit [Bryobacteraceae bacterium]
MKKLWLVLLVVIAAVVGWGILRKSEPPKVNFAHVKRQTLISSLPTNGKVEPFEWQAARAETAGLVSQVSVHEGETVAKGALLATLTDPSLQSEIQAGEAKVAEARANLAALEAGGRPAEIADIENGIARSRFDLQQATKEYDSLKRLVEKQAATPLELQAAQAKVRQLELAIEGLQQRRASLVAMPDVAAAKARLQDTEVALNLARQRASQSVVRAPIAGTVYGLAVRTGGYLNVGDLVANVGRMDRLRVRVYVDEPELGRVAEGEAVTLTWQALPGKKWSGVVQQKPTSVEALGSRQVGEVVCIIENPGRELVPGTNVDAEIRTAVVDYALVIPRESLRHDASGDYVFGVKGDIVERRPVKTGNSSISLVQVTEGLADGDAVALPSDNPIKAGDRVTAM